MAKEFLPREVRAAMQASGATVTCLPVRLDGNEWETALFFRLAGPECKRDRQVLAKTHRPLPVTLETNVLELPSAAVVTLRAEVHTLADDPLAGEILLTPGGSRTHFDALKLLSKQDRLCWFFGDEDFRQLHSQQNPLDVEQRESIDDLLRDAVRHDALVRSTGRYDAQAALSEVVVHYDLREGIVRDGLGHDRKQ
ncbi:MAG: hypothetical protein ACE5H7_03215 [Acidiferrobacterales bacterium]